MLAVIFEVVPQAGERKTYLEIAERLSHELDRVDGFVSIERFESLSIPGKILSLSFWRDEEAVRQWRNLEEHRHAQIRGRHGVFADYRLRVAAVMRDYGLKDRAEVPSDSAAIHDQYFTEPK